MNPRQALSCICILCFAQTLLGQGLSTNTLSKGTTFVRFNASGLADPFETNISFGAAYHFQPLWAVTFDAAWVFRSAFYENKMRANGFILRSAVRRYAKEDKRVYYEPELHYKSMYYQMQDWLGRDCVNNVPSYEEYTRFSIRKQSLGVHIKAGAAYLLRKNSRLWLEVYGGLGVRLTWYGLYHQPNSCYDFNPVLPFENSNTTTQVLPAFPAGLRLLYRLK